VEVAGLERLFEFAKQHPNIKSALERWRGIVEEADWKDPAEMRSTFRSADIVGERTVFNVGGNKCRLISLVNYSKGRLLIQHVLSHAEYDKGDWKTK
jgi:mRNA interferase HigB